MMIPKRFGFFLTALFLISTAFAKDEQIYKKLETFAKVLSYVETNYIENVKSEKLIDDAIKGMLENLDPHTAYMPAELFREMKVDTKGEFYGIGAEISIKDSVLTVVSPIEGTPADEAGIQAGDRILKIDGAATKGMSLMDAVNKMRGPQGTKVNLTIEREGTKGPLEFAIKRGTVHISAISSQLLDKHYAYIRVKNFQERADKELSKALDKMSKESSNTIKGVILDLRNNPGGLLDQAIKISDEFLDTGAIVTTKGRQESFQEVEMAHKEGTRPSWPMITLVNEGSASASEIVAGALQDHGRSIILGTPTFGKGSVQTIIDLDDGSGLKLTIARYYTPKGRSIQAEGITPDIIVSATEPEKVESTYLREKDLKGHMSNPNEKPKTEELKTKSAVGGLDLEHDFQLSRALGYLKTWEIFRSSVLPKAAS
jgi:carboxyl-terminal processing protease